MIYPSADKLENWGSKYSLVVLAAKRAKQLKGGAATLIKTDSRNPLTVALEEIAAGAIECRVADNDLLPTVSQVPEVATLLDLPEESSEEVGEGAEVSPEAMLEEALTAAQLDEEKQRGKEEAPQEDEDDLEDHGVTLEDDEEEEEDVPGFAEEDETSDLIPELGEAAPEEEAINVPKKRGRKPKAKVEPEPEALGIDEKEDIEQSDEESDD